MKTNIAPIFVLREICLQQISPNYYKSHQDVIRRASLAAQEYVTSGKIKEYNYSLGKNFRQLPGYLAVHEKFNLKYPMNDNDSIPVQGVNAGLVMDLSHSFLKDKSNAIIDEAGNIIDPNKACFSEVLKVYQNTSSAGIPADALKIMSKNQFTQILDSLRQKTK